MKSADGLNQCPIGPSLPHLVPFPFTGTIEKSSGSQSVIRGPLGGPQDSLRGSTLSKHFITISDYLSLPF